MKEVSSFNRLAENTIPKEHFQNTLTPVSARKAKGTYEDILDSGENTAKSDKKTFKNGTGISLNPRLALGHANPQHRAWGTRLEQLMRPLKALYDNWVKGPHKKEDLTVAIAFSPTTAIQQADTEDVSLYNKYFTPQESMRHIATSNNGVLYNFEGRQRETKGNWQLYVMDMQGNLFIHPYDKYCEEDGIKKRIGHPVFTRGEAVGCAGALRIAQGKITHIDTTSGHYSPKSYSLFRAVSELQTRGVLAENRLSHLQLSLIFRKKLPPWVY